jgi:hypothetical protein
MFQSIGSQDGKGIGNGNPVITPQRCPQRCYIIPLHCQLQAFLFKINLTSRLLFTDHVQMPLNNQRLHLFIASRSFLDNNHITQFILMHLQAMLPGKSHTIITQFLFPIGGMGNAAYFLKVPKHFPWLQI